MTTTYGLHISSELEKRIGRCRAAVSGAIRQRLRDIADKAGKGRSPAKKPTIVKEPPLRSHVFDGYQMLYQVDVQTRRVVVLDFGRLPTARAQPRSARAAAGRRRASRSDQAV